MGPKSGRYNQYNFQIQLEEDFAESFKYFLTFLAEIIGEDRGFLYFVLQCIEEGIFGLTKTYLSLQNLEELDWSSRNIDEIFPQF